jgi:hypothetical protein
MSKIKLSAIVTGFPPGVRPPKPLPGESMLQLVIRNHPQAWSICLESLRNVFHASDEVCSRLTRGETIADLDPAVRREVERFMNLRLPSYGRTLQGLAELRDQMRETGGLRQLWQMELTEIIWLRQKKYSSDAEAEKFAASLGVTVLNIDTQESLPLVDLGSLLNHVHGDYLLTLPGGSSLFVPMAITSLISVLLGFQEKPKMALYSDSCYCLIYRVSALRDLILSGKRLSAELHDNARMLQEAGFELAADKDSIHGPLVEIETLYGGQNYNSCVMRSGRGASLRSGRTPWWRRLLGLE